MLLVSIICIFYILLFYITNRKHYWCELLLFLCFAELYDKKWCHCCTSLVFLYFLSFYTLKLYLIGIDFLCLCFMILYVDEVAQCILDIFFKQVWIHFVLQTKFILTMFQLTSIWKLSHVKLIWNLLSENNIYLVWHLKLIERLWEWISNTFWSVSCTFESINHGWCGETQISWFSFQNVIWKLGKHLNIIYIWIPFRTYNNWVCRQIHKLHTNANICWQTPLKTVCIVIKNLILESWLYQYNIVYFFVLICCCVFLCILYMYILFKFMYISCIYACVHIFFVFTVFFLAYNCLVWFFVFFLV